MLEQVHVVDNSILQLQDKDRSSSSTVGTEGQIMAIQSMRISSSEGTQNQIDVFHVFKNQKWAERISGKLVEKAISWLQSTGFIQNFSFSTVITSVSIFYATIARTSIDKNQLESMLCSCILLANKLASSNNIITLETIKNLIGNRQSTIKVIEWQQKILVLHDFNLYFNFPVFCCLQSLCEQNKSKFMFLCEILLLKDPKVLYQSNIISQILKVVQSDTSLVSKQICEKITKTLKRNICDHLLNKYMSKFDVHTFVSNIDDRSTCL